MITRRTKVQLLVFVLITLVGVTYVGARYARLDRVFFDDAYTVVAHFPDSGGIFAGAEVTYRGVTVGEVEKLELTDEGVDVHLDIDNEYDDIPADALAVVGNRSAVGEQYVELQPQTDDGPYLEEDSEIAAGEHPDPDPDRPAARATSPTTTSVGRQGRPADRRHARWASPSTAPATTSARSSTPRTRSSRPRTPTSTPPRS